jgi:hypothetical protein
MTSLVTPGGRLDRRAVMTEAHRQFRLMRRYDWSFGRCLSFAWAKAREQRARATVALGSLTVYHPRQKEMPPGVGEVVLGLNKATRDHSMTRRLVMPYCSHGKRFLADHDASPAQG